ncbi:MAG: hypothetical protein KGI08_10585 [Thaumarchaeota archaeon]|nr:hypothetical protein [Nitrososphaerota archaeon]
MPLIKGSSQHDISRNIVELHHANASKPQGKKRSDSQIAAIAYAVARESKKKK